MDSLIDKIIDIDSNAREKVDNAEQTAREIMNAAKQKSDDIKRKYKGQEEKRLAIVLKEYSRFADEEIEAIVKQQNEKISKLEKIIAVNSPAWKKEIINNILGAVV